MSGYWVRKRLLFTLIMSIATALIVGLLFVCPVIDQKADHYHSQSMYRNTDIDFIAPEPSFEQVDEIAGTNGIDRLFPYYLTTIQAKTNGRSRNTTVLLSDQLDALDITMYNDRRLIKKSSVMYDAPIYVDWQFCHDMSCKIGDTVSFSINGESVEYRIYAIYETNSLYDGGAILAPISASQKESISQNAKRSGYTGMYISSVNYEACRSYLKTDYRPLGRLKDRAQFDSDEQYQIHYDAIMSSGYANEITDLRVKESNLNKHSSILMAVLGAALAAAVVIAFNLAMAKRGCEKVYFTKHCIPKGRNAKPYYTLSFVCEVCLGIVVYIATIALKIYTGSTFIPRAALGMYLVLVPLFSVIAEIGAYLLNICFVSQKETGRPIAGEEAWGGTAPDAALKPYSKTDVPGLKQTNAESAPNESDDAAKMPRKSFPVKNEKRDTE